MKTTGSKAPTKRSGERDTSSDPSEGPRALTEENDPEIPSAMMVRVYPMYTRTDAPPTFFVAIATAFSHHSMGDGGVQHGSIRVSRISEPWQQEVDQRWEQHAQHRGSRREDHGLRWCCCWCSCFVRLIHERDEMISRLFSTCLWTSYRKYYETPFFQNLIRPHYLSCIFALSEELWSALCWAMASYWVSQERYFCKYCKVWLSNHQAVSGFMLRN